MNCDIRLGLDLRDATRFIPICSLAALCLCSQIPIDAADSAKADQAMESPSTDSELSESTVNALLRNGMSKHKAGDDAAAEHYFKQALDIDHENANALFNLGVIAEQRGDLDLALREYGAALKSEPDDRDLQAAQLQVKQSIATREASIARARPAERLRIHPFATSETMPPMAPSFTINLPAGRNQYQTNLARPTAASYQIPPQSSSEDSQGFRQALMQTAFGVARLMHHDTCSLCGGLLQRW
jgi:tetratricopeptide (TPR) repeat protein